MKITKKEIIFLLLILIFSFLIRFWRITQLPPNVTGDEINFLLESLKIIEGRGNSFWGLCEPSQQSCFSNYLISLFLKILGLKKAILAIRLPSIILSTLAVLPFYWLIRQYFSITPSLLTTILFTSSYWNLNFSRSAWNNIHLVFYFLIFICFYKKWWLAKKIKYLVIAGLFSGLMFYGYRVGKVFLLILLIYSVFSLVCDRNSRKNALKYFSSFLVILIISLLMFLPQLVFIAKNRQSFLARPRATLIFLKKEPVGYYGMKTWGQIAGYQFRQTLRGILFLDKVKNDDVENLRYLPDGSPLVDLGTRVLIIFGLFILLTKFSRLRISFWVYATYLTSFFISSVTVGPPNSARLVLILPIFYFLVGFSLDFLARQKNFRIPLIIFCFILVFLNLRIYFNWAGSEALRAARMPALEISELPAWLKFQIPATPQDKLMEIGK